MTDPAFHLLSAAAFVFVIEGLLYAIFPEQVKRMMAMALSLPADRLRGFGLAVAATGAAIAWLLQQLH